jgi:hypothetical protein
LIIIDGHGLHVTLEVIKQAHEFGSNIIILPFHMSHALQTLSASYFKPFKTNLKKERNATMAKTEYNEPKKIALAKWVDKTLDQTKHQNMV